MTARYNDADRPGARLLNEVDERFGRPFTYSELKRRQSTVDNDQLSATFAGLIGGGHLAETTIDTGHAPELTADELDALTALRTYLDENDAWVVGRAFPEPSIPDDAQFIQSEPYMDDITAWTDDVYDTLVEKGAIGKHGGWAIMSEDSLLATYAHGDELVYGRHVDPAPACSPIDTPYPRGGSA